MCLAERTFNQPRTEDELQHIFQNESITSAS